MTLYDLDQLFERVIKDFPERRRMLVESCGDKLYQEVIQNIERDVQSDTGNLKSAVTKVVGSGGGYAAIKPDWKKAPHTHLVENGHKVVPRGKRKWRLRRPQLRNNTKNTGKRYKKGSVRNSVGWVAGKHMYRNSLNSLATELEQDAQKTLKQLVGDIFD